MTNPADCLIIVVTNARIRKLEAYNLGIILSVPILFDFAPLYSIDNHEVGSPPAVCCSEHSLCAS